MVNIQGNEGFQPAEGGIIETAENTARGAKAEAFSISPHFELPITSDGRADEGTNPIFGDADPAPRIPLWVSLAERYATTSSRVVREKKIADRTFWALALGTFLTAFSKLSFLNSLNPFLFLSAGGAWGYGDGLSDGKKSSFVGVKKAGIVAAGITLLNVGLGLVFPVGISLISLPAVLATMVAVAVPYFIGWSIGRARGNYLQSHASR